MQNLKIVVITLLFISQCQFLFAQKFVIDGNWKYSLTDDSLYSSINFNDTEWKEKDASNIIFTKAEMPESLRFLWLRKSLVIPSSLKDQLSTTGALAVYLGRIFESDEFFFNGKLIGKTIAFDIPRSYLIRTESIKWDKENIIAIRMRRRQEKAGMESTSPPYVAAALPSSLFLLGSSAIGAENKQQVNNKQVTFNCIVDNQSIKSYKANITAELYDISNKKIVAFSKNVTATPGINKIGFPYKSSSPFLKIHYTLTVPEYRYTAEKNDEYGYHTVIYKPAKMVITDKVNEVFIPADLQDQVIKGWLGERMAINTDKRLYRVDEKEMLAGFINKPGSHAWIGEHIGKFLEAASNSYKNTNDAAIKIQLDRSAHQLIAAQLEDGYLGTYTPKNHWTSWDVWSHKYNLIGLLSYYSISGYKPALDASKKVGDLLCTTFGTKPGQKDIVKAGEHVGMAATSVLEPMVDLYRYTGDKKYLDFCFYIIESFDQKHGPKILTTLTTTGGQVNKTANSKAYEMLTNLVGVVKLYKVTGDENYLKPILLAWKDIVTNRRYITGTASSWEHFKDEQNLPGGVDDHMGEGCVTTTWIQLNFQLLSLTGDMKYLNELERSVYNHLTGAENPQTGGVSYYTPLVGIKPYRTVITCCMSSIPRGIAMIPLFANGKIDSKPAFLFYQPGVYTTTANNAKVSFTTVTNFPADGNLSINVNTASSTPFAVQFRKPYWAEGFSLQINGQKQLIDSEETVIINRIWKGGDKIDISFKMPLIVIEGGKSYPGQVAFQRGPQILAFDKDVNGFDVDMVSINVKAAEVLPSSSILPNKWIGAQAFNLKAILSNTNKDIILVPYADASQTGGVISTWIKKANPVN
ncbi:MAG: glycoside hydrolase family 127 protein [Pyrinomonadaceae bacterium]|nr:glycoside hydrolase family 127 protein [Sphingobacteriaceae bacterium]